MVSTRSASGSPDHPVALELLTAFGGGLAAPSANRFGRVSPTTAAAVRAELGDDVAADPRWGCEHGRRRVHDRRLHLPIRPESCASAASPRSNCSRCWEWTCRSAGRRVPRAPWPRTTRPAHASRWSPVVTRSSAAGARTRGRVGRRARGPGIAARRSAADRDVGHTRRRRRVRPGPVRHAPRGRCSRARRGGRGTARPDRHRGRRHRPAPSGRNAPLALPPMGVRAGAGLDERPIGVFDSGLGGLTVLRALVDLLPARIHAVLRRYRAVPVRTEARGRCAQVHVGDRGPAGRSWRQAARRRVQQRDRGRARRAAGPVRDAGHRRRGTGGAGRGLGDPVRAASVRSGPSARSRPVPTSRLRPRPASSSRAPRARVSSSSSRPATSTRTRSVSSPNGCSHRCAPRASTRWSSAARTTRCSHVRSVT